MWLIGSGSENAMSEIVNVAASKAGVTRSGVTSSSSAGTVSTGFVRLRSMKARQEKVRPYLNRWQNALVGIGRSGNGIGLVRSMAARRPQLSVE